MIACSKDRTKQVFYSLFLISLLAFGCRKSEDTVGANFVGNRNPFNAQGSDTASIVTFSALHDSFTTQTLSYKMLGDMNDPVLGTSKCNIFSQYSLPINSFSYGTNFQGIDSIVLQLNYATSSSYYGNLNSIQNIKVYELTEDLYADSVYYSNRIYSYDQSKPIGDWTGDFSAVDDSVTISVGGVSANIAPHLRIKLTDPNFVARMASGESNGAFTDNASFQTQFKGFAIIPSTVSQPAGDGCMAYMNLANSVTSVVVYYNGGTLKAEFPIYQNSVNTNQFKHTINPAIPIRPLMTTMHFDTTYLLPMAGIKTRILLPNIVDYVKQNKIAITGAELILKVQDGSDPDPYQVPASLRLLAADSLGRNDFLRDQFETYYDGIYDPSKRQYKFNLMRQIQYILSEYMNNNQDVNYGLNLIVPADNPIAANRLILDTRKGQIKLNLTYTVIK